MKTINHQTFILTSIAALMMTFSPLSHAKIYKWVDQQGQTHYTATPPPASQVKSEVENIESDIKANAGKYQKPPESQKPAEKKKDPKPKEVELAGPSKELIEYCAGLKKNLETLQKNYRTTWIDEDGTRTRLDQEQRKEKVDSIVEKIGKDCSGVS